LGGDSSVSSIKPQVFDAAGGKVGGEFLVNTTTENQQNFPTITGLSNGGFVVTWSDRSGLDGDANPRSIKAQVFDATGTKVGSEFLVNTTTAGSQDIPIISALSDGGFVIAWSDQSDNSDKAQVFDATGTKVGSEFPVTTTTVGGVPTAIANRTGGAR
jgi:rRNA processing protein Gar1